MVTKPFPLPRGVDAVTVVPAPQPGPQNWAGAPAVHPDDDGSLVIAYRERERAPDGTVTDRNVIARSADGVHLEPVATLTPGALGVAMVERPALTRTDDGRWRMHVSLATPHSKHWWVGLLEAATPEELPGADLRAAFPGHETAGFKDPVVLRAGGRWHAWLCRHPLDLPGHEDRMSTTYATSADGLDWTDHGTVLRGREGFWDARGARVTAVLDDGRAAYDGRPTAEANWFEQLGVAHPDGAGPGLLPQGDAPGFDARYLSVLSRPGGGYRVWYEARLPEGHHELRTELLTT
ncbi:hypothetical protein ACIB24_01090 [Spongisporangium articulatum]|uniref:Glycosyl hydrolases family 43 n=1 Tax=Spongisporangium articulatum TaxID=3362603 RepID=A0ABW8AI20_9ACTN